MSFEYLCIKTVYLCTIHYYCKSVYRSITSPLYYAQTHKIFQHGLSSPLKMPIIILLLYFLILSSGKMNRHFVFWILLSYFLTYFCNIKAGIFPSIDPLHPTYVVYLCLYIGFLYLMWIYGLFEYK